MGNATASAGGARRDPSSRPRRRRCCVLSTRVAFASAASSAAASAAAAAAGAAEVPTSAARSRDDVSEPAEVPEPVVEYDLGSGSLAPTGGSALRSSSSSASSSSSLWGRAAAWSAASPPPALVDVAAICGDLIPDQEFEDDEEMGRVLRFSAGEGVYIPHIARLVPIEENTEYTVRLVLKLDNLFDRARILNVNFGSQKGIYTRRGGLRLSRLKSHNCVIGLKAGKWYSFTVSTSPSKNLMMYVNGYACGRHFPAPDWEKALQIVSEHMLFFNDDDHMSCDGNDGGDHSAGHLKSVQVWRQMLGDESVAALEQRPTGAAPPPPPLAPAPAPCRAPTPSCRQDAVLCYDMGTGSLGAVGRLRGSPPLVDVGALCAGRAEPQLFVDDPELGSVLGINGGQGLLLGNLKRFVPSGAETEFTLRMVLRIAAFDDHGRIFNTNFGNESGFYFFDDGVLLLTDNGAEKQVIDFGECDDDWTPDEWHALTISTAPDQAVYYYIDGKLCGQWHQSPAWESGVQIINNEMLFFNDASPASCSMAGDNVGPAYLKSIELYPRRLGHGEVSGLEASSEALAPAPAPSLDFCAAAPNFAGMGAPLSPAGGAAGGAAAHASANAGAAGAPATAHELPRRGRAGAEPASSASGRKVGHADDNEEDLEVAELIPRQASWPPDPEVLAGFASLVLTGGALLVVGSLGCRGEALKELVQSGSKSS